MLTALSRTTLCVHITRMHCVHWAVLLLHGRAGVNRSVRLLLTIHSVQAYLSKYLMGMYSWDIFTFLIMCYDEYMCYWEVHSEWAELSGGSPSWLTNKLIESFNQAYRLIGMDKITCQVQDCACLPENLVFKSETQIKSKYFAYIQNSKLRSPTQKGKACSSTPSISGLPKTTCLPSSRFQWRNNI